MAAAYAAQAAAAAALAGVLGRRAGARRARGSAALPARRAGGRAARCRARTRRWPPSASACAAPERFFAATAGGEETLYAGDGAVERADRGGAARAASRWRRSIPALAPAGGAAARRGGRDRGRRARPRPLRARRAIGSGAAGRDRGAAVPAVSGSAASTAARSPIWPPGATRSPAELAEVGSYEEELAARQAAADAAATRARRGRGGADGASRQQAARSLETKVDATLRELGFARRACRCDDDVPPSAPRRRRWGDHRRALPVRARLALPVDRASAGDRRARRYGQPQWRGARPAAVRSRRDPYRRLHFAVLGDRRAVRRGLRRPAHPAAGPARRSDSASGFAQ